MILSIGEVRRIEDVFVYEILKSAHHLLTQVASIGTFDTVFLIFPCTGRCWIQASQRIGRGPGLDRSDDLT